MEEEVLRAETEGTAAGLEAVAATAAAAVRKEAVRMAAEMDPARY